MELKSKRTLNSKHFLLEDGKTRGDFHVGHIHYNDKLGGTGLRSIDWTLSFDEVKRGWGFQYHSFHPFLPEYADEWVEFRDLFDDKDQTIKYKAHASHVKGRLVMPEEIGLKDTSVNCVIYDDAFGEGKDYILYFTRSALKKVVRIREAFKGTEEQRFTWDIDFPKEYSKEKKVKRVKDKDEYELDITQDKTFDSDRITKIGNNKGDGKEWHTYLRPFMAWDSGNGIEQKYQIVNVEYKANDKTITKIVPAAFLIESTGDVFADTTTSYSPTTDSDIYRVGGTDFTTERTATTGTKRGGDSGYVGCFRKDGNGNYIFDRWFSGAINTSGIDDDATITDASFVVTGFGKGDGSLYTATFNVYSSDCSDSVVADDYNNWGISQSLTAYSDSTISLADFNTSGTNTWTFNTSGKNAINKTGNTKLCILNTNSDVGNSAPTNDSTHDYNIHFRNSAYAGTDSDPYLSVTYGTGAIVTPSGSLGLLGCGM